MRHTSPTPESSRGLENRTRNIVLHPAPQWATSPIDWTVGLMFQRTDETALIFQRTTPVPIMIHTFFVRGSLDVVVLDDAYVVIALVERLPPFRYWNSGQLSRTFIELPPGTLRRTGTTLADRFALPRRI